MNKIRLLIENLFIYGLGGIISKLIPVIMIPVITRLMPSSEYIGINDLITVLISFSSAAALLGIYDSMFRLFFDKEDINYKIELCSTAFFITFLSSVVISFLLFLFRNYLSELMFKNSNYEYIITIAAITTFATATNIVIAAPVRMQNNRRLFLLFNTVTPLVAYSVSVPMLLNGFYVLALPLAAMISAIFIEICFFLINKKWFRVSYVKINLIKPLLAIGLPTLPSILVYWVFNSSDRIMIANILDVSEAGIYSIGSKLGLISQLIYIAFSGGWQYFAFSTMKDNDQVESTSRIFECFSILSFISTVFICIFSYSIYNLLFEGVYTTSYIISPYLFLAPMLQMSFQIIGNQFLVIKKTLPSMLILLCGAIINVLLNLILIPLAGIEGAAIATLGGYITSLVLCIAILKKLKLIQLSKRYYLSSFLMIIFIITWRLFFSEKLWLGFCAVTFFLIMIFFIYKQNVKQLCLKIQSVWKTK